MKARLLAPLLFLALLAPAQEKPAEWGLIANKTTAFQGYTLFAPLNHKSTYLIDMAGEIVHQWEHEDQVGNSVYLLPDGRLLRPLHVGDNQVFGAPPFGGGRLQIINWDGEVEWDYTLSSATRYQHHDVRPMPNGNVLALVWEFKSRDEALAAGRNPELLEGDKLFPESIVEIKPTGPTSGDVVWEWHLWDHLVQDFDAAKANYGVVAEHPELLDINFINAKGADWNHSNGIDYNPELDQIIINMRSMSEFFILDHSTTIAEARSHAAANKARAGTSSTVGEIRRATCAAASGTAPYTSNTTRIGFVPACPALATSWFSTTATDGLAAILHRWISCTRPSWPAAATAWKRRHTDRRS